MQAGRQSGKQANRNTGIQAGMHVNDKSLEKHNEMFWKTY